MAQQTAVEWLIYELNTRQKPLYNNQIDELFEKAKQIEKENLEDCWIAAHQAGRFEGKGIAEEDWQTFFNYYNETYGK